MNSTQPKQQREIDRIVIVIERDTPSAQALYVNSALVYSVDADGGLWDFGEAIMHGRSTLPLDVLAEARTDFPAAAALADAVTDKLGDPYSRDEVTDLTVEVGRLRGFVLLLTAVVIVKTGLLMLLLMLL